MLARICDTSTVTTPSLSSRKKNVIATIAVYSVTASLSLGVLPSAQAQNLIADVVQTDKFTGDSGQDYFFGISVALSDTTALIGSFEGDLNPSIPPTSDNGSAYVFNLSTGQRTAKLRASDGALGDNFGISVALSGNTALVGANGADISARVDQGAAYLFNATTGTQERKLVASDGQAGDNFGSGVALLGDIALVGANQDDFTGQANRGSAYLFNAATGAEIQKLVASDGAANDQFGRSVALMGNFALIGATGGNANQGAAYLFDITTGQQLFRFTAIDGQSGDQFGFSVSLSGNLALIGSRFGGSLNQGSAYLFDITTGEQLFEFSSNDGANGDLFGNSVALSGSTALVGAWQNDIGGVSNQGAAYRFQIIFAPEPGSLALLGLCGSVCAGLVRRRKRN